MSVYFHNKKIAPIVKKEVEPEITGYAEVELPYEYRLSENPTDFGFSRVINYKDYIYLVYTGSWRSSYYLDRKNKTWVKFLDTDDKNEGYNPRYIILPDDSLFVYGSTNGTSNIFIFNPNTLEKTQIGTFSSANSAFLINNYIYFTAANSVYKLDYKTLDYSEIEWESEKPQVWRGFYMEQCANNLFIRNDSAESKTILAWYDTSQDKIKTLLTADSKSYYHALTFDNIGTFIANYGSSYGDQGIYKINEDNYSLDKVCDYFYSTIYSFQSSTNDLYIWTNDSSINIDGFTHSGIWKFDMSQNKFLQIIDTTGITDLGYSFNLYEAADGSIFAKCYIANVSFLYLDPDTNKFEYIDIGYTGGYAYFFEFENKLFIYPYYSSYSSNSIKQFDKTNKTFVKVCDSNFYASYQVKVFKSNDNDYFIYSTSSNLGFYDVVDSKFILSSSTAGALSATQLYDNTITFYGGYNSWYFDSDTKTFKSTNVNNIGYIFNFNDNSVAVSNYNNHLEIYDYRDKKYTKKVSNQPLGKLAECAVENNKIKLLFYNIMHQHYYNNESGSLDIGNDLSSYYKLGDLCIQVNWYNSLISGKGLVKMLKPVYYLATGFDDDKLYNPGDFYISSYNRTIIYRY